MRWTDPTELFVHPRTVALTGPRHGFLRTWRASRRATCPVATCPSTPCASTSPGDDRRHVHWKSTARTGELMVRQFEETRRSHLAIALSTDRGDYAADEDEFELAVSVAGSLGLHAFREERDLTIATHAGALHTRTPGRMLDDLTRIEVGLRRAGIVAVASTLAADAPEVSLAVLLVGSAVPPTVLNAAASRLPVDVRVIALQCVLGASPQRRAIADLVVVTLGLLDDLPAAMRRLGDV